MEQINKRAFEIIKMVSFFKEQKLQSKPSKLVGEKDAINLGELSKLKIYSKDASGNIIEKYIPVKGGKVGFDFSTYNLVQEIADNILISLELQNKTDRVYIEGKCFDWLISTYQNNKADSNLLTYIKQQLDDDLGEKSFYFKIESLCFESPFKIGNITIKELKREFLVNKYNSDSREKQVTLDEYLKAFDSFKDKPIAFVSVEATPQKALNLAKAEVELSINALKCFFMNESVCKSFQLPDPEFKYNDPQKSEYISQDNYERLNIHFSNQQGVQPIAITDNRLKHIQPNGFDFVSNFLKNRKKTELVVLVENSINNLGIAISKRNLYERIVGIISFFEAILIPEKRGRGNGETILKSDVLPKLYNDNNDNKKINIRAHYDIRDKYLHNRIEKKIDIQKLLQFQNIGLDLLFQIIKLSFEHSTVVDIYKYYNIKQ